MKPRIILIIDNDVAINLFEYLFLNNKLHFDRLISHLSADYFQIWIPQKVKSEFFGSPKKKKRREKILERIFGAFQIFKICPIPVSNFEINIENNFSDKNIGETDAIIQASKARMFIDNRLNFSDVHLFLRDKGAILRANSKNIGILKYTDFSDKMKEVGIILP